MEAVSIVSTYATDILLNEVGTILSINEGGPLLFIESVLREQNIPYSVITGEKATVEILIKDNQEFGKINPIRKQKIPVNKLGKWCIVSTLLDEWDLQGLGTYTGKVCLDVQGYVRDGSRFGGKKKWDGINDIVEHIYCIKGTNEEIQYLPQSVVEKQKRRILLITHGTDPIELYAFGKLFTITPHTVAHPKNTIGAGDVFFATFVAYLTRRATTVAATQEAIKKTHAFLMKKTA